MLESTVPGGRKLATKASKAPVPCLLRGGGSPSALRFPGRTALQAPAHQVRCTVGAKGSCVQYLPTFHAPLYMSPNPAPFALIPSPAGQRRMVRRQVGLRAPGKEMAAQRSAQVKLKNSHLQREKLGQCWVDPEPRNQWRRCSDVRLRVSSSPPSALFPYPS